MVSGVDKSITNADAAGTIALFAVYAMITNNSTIGREHVDPAANVAIITIMVNIIQILRRPNSSASFPPVKVPTVLHAEVISMRKPACIVENPSLCVMSKDKNGNTNMSPISSIRRTTQRK